MATKIKLTILLLMLFTSAKSQMYTEGDKFRIGLKAGPAISMLGGNALSKPSLHFGFTGGLYYKYKFKHGFHFQTEISPTLRGSRFDNGPTGYNKFTLLYMDMAQLVLKDFQSGDHTHAGVLGLQPSVLVQSWVYNPVYLLSPAARDVKLNAIDLFLVFGYQYSKKIVGIQSVIKIGLTNINRGLNMYDVGGLPLQPATNNSGNIRNISWETTLSF